MPERFTLCADQKLVGLFGANTPKPLPVIGFIGGEGAPQWVPAGFEIRPGHMPPHCRGVAVDPERFDALTVQVAAKVVGASKEGIDDLAERLRLGGEPMRRLLDNLTRDLVSLATILNGGTK